MEETEAMATQFSSLGVTDEILTRLPDHIIHRILVSLPSIKDVVRTSLISKSWLQAWRTFPITVFNLKEFVSSPASLSREEAKRRSNQFIRFVDDSLQRFGKLNRDGNGEAMKIFNLSTVNKMASHTSRWIGTALDCKVENLVLRILMDGSMRPIMIPERAFCAYWLKSLMFVGPMIRLALTEGSRVDLPLLKSLHIHCSDIRDDHLNKLLSGCPALEDISLLNCESLSKVNISEHPNLESLEVTVSSTKADLTAIRVRAPKLKFFSYSCESLYKRNIVVKIYNSPDLKCLKIRDWNKTDEWFHKIVAQFPLIERLTLDWCNALKKIRISNPLLKRINIMNCNNLEDVIINCKKLASFNLLTVPSSIPKPSVRMEMDNPPNDCTTQILTLIKYDILMEASLYCKLKEFLTRPFTFKSLNFIVHGVLSAVDGDMMGEEVHKKLPPAACKIEKLKLGVNAPSSCHSHILNGLLSACHPTTIKLVVFPDNPFIKLVCKELGKREKNSKCFCKDDFKCWKHQLKEVKIEKIKGIKLEEDLDWDALLCMLPTLKDGNDIYFKLMW